jgi:DNA repair exonuclease SbcCD ATPase subunit
VLILQTTINDFKKYVGKYTFNFDKINLISGENGAGKSTIALHALLFALHGYSENKLSKLTPKGVDNPNTWVEITLSHLGNTYIIKRSIPTKIELTINGIPSTLANNQLKQEEIDKVFKDVSFLKKFRLIDIKDSINLLEQTQSNLRKTLVNLEDSLNLSPVRDNLSELKNKKEQFNKDSHVLYNHYPSVNRYSTIDMNVQMLNMDISENEKEITKQEAILRERSSFVSKSQWQKSNLLAQKSKLSKTVCHVCGQQIKINKQKELIEQIEKDLSAVENDIVSFGKEEVLQKAIVDTYKNKRVELIQKKEKLNKLLSKLDARLKQKDYIWSNKDVEITKQAIKEVDGFSTYYVTEKLKTLEPLINNILNKVGFVVKFDIVDNNKFDIRIFKGNLEFEYTELSNGERLLVGIAFQLALLLDKNESGLIIADEGFSSLSEINLNLMLDLFINSPFQLIAVIHRYSSNNTNIKNIVL